MMPPLPFFDLECVVVTELNIALSQSCSCSVDCETESGLVKVLLGIALSRLESGA